jgi:leucyl-tRNA synthetase
MYLAFMGPYGVADSYPWDPNGFVGIRRFLERVLSLKDKISDTNNTNIDKTIKKVQEDIERLKFNTAISSMMILVNTLEDEDNVSEKDYKMFLQILAPFAPHLTEEIWHDLGEEKSIHLSSWPKYDEAKIKDEKVKVIIQVNGKLRDEVEIDAELGEEEVKNLVLSREKIQTHIGGGEIKKFIYVKGKIANIVI